MRSPESQSPGSYDVGCHRHHLPLGYQLGGHDGHELGARLACCAKILWGSDYGNGTLAGHGVVTGSLLSVGQLGLLSGHAVVGVVGPELLPCQETGSWVDIG